MSFSVEENAVFIHEFSKNLPTVGGGTPLPPPPPPRSLRSLAYYRPPKIKSWLRHWSPCDQILCLVRAQVHFVYSAHVHNLMTSLLMFIHASSQPSTKIWGTEWIWLQNENGQNNLVMFILLRNEFGYKMKMDKIIWSCSFCNGMNLVTKWKWTK